MTDALLQRWQAAWPQALATWSRYTRLVDPRLCASRLEASREGLTGSFAMIRLDDQRIVVDLEGVRRLGLDDYAVEVLAHEIGHHVLVPANVTDHVRMLARMRAGLPTLEQHAPMVANLYADLIINDRLQRQGGLRMADIYRKLAGHTAAGPTSAVWNLYLRIYEHLWKLEVGSLGAHKGDERSETDAWLGARLVRVYANDWMGGAGRFASLLLHHLVEDAQALSHEAIRGLFDTASAADGAEPFGGTMIDADEKAGAIHPAEDPAITGAQDDPSAAPGEGAGAAEGEASAGGQAREPYEYGEILRAAGLRVDDHEAAVRYYRERATPYLVPYPQRRVPDTPEPQLEGLEPWEIGDPLDELDGLQSVLQSPRAIPGVTTVRRRYGQEPGRVPLRRPVDLDLYVDSSGSMPNPQVRVSFLSLAGAVIALSALRTGALVQVTLWSGKDQFMHTGGFVRDETAILRVLTGFYGGGTTFPIHLLRDTWLGKPRRERSAHILMISDDGISTMFDRDERGNDGWEVAAQALAAAGGGGSMALNIPADWDSVRTGWNADAFERLRRARSEQAWEIHAVSRLDDLLAFARSFSTRHYA